MRSRSFDTSVHHDVASREHAGVRNEHERVARGVRATEPKDAHLASAELHAERVREPEIGAAVHELRALLDARALRADIRLHVGLEHARCELVRDESRLGERLRVEPVPRDVIVVPVRVDHVEHRLGCDATDLRDHLPRELRVLARVDYEHAVVADDRGRVTAHDRVAERLDERIDAARDLDRVVGKRVARLAHGGGGQREGQSSATRAQCGRSRRSRSHGPPAYPAAIDARLRRCISRERSDNTRMRLPESS